MDEHSTSSVSTTLLDKLLHEIISSGAQVPQEDISMLDKFLMGVLINVICKSPSLEDSYFGVVYRIMLNSPTNAETDTNQRVKVVDEMFVRKNPDFNLWVFQAIYNEVKYRMSVKWDYTRWDIPGMNESLLRLTS